MACDDVTGRGVRYTDKRRRLADRTAGGGVAFKHNAADLQDVRWIGQAERGVRALLRQQQRRVMPPDMGDLVGLIPAAVSLAVTMWRRPPP